MLVSYVKPNHSAVPNRLIRCESFWLPMKLISCCGLGLREGLVTRKKLPFRLQEAFGHLGHSRLVEHYVRPLDDLSVLGVLELVLDLAVRTVTKENAFPRSWFEFSTVVFRYEGIRLASENPQFIGLLPVHIS